MHPLGVLPLFLRNMSFAFSVCGHTVAKTLPLWEPCFSHSFTVSFNSGKETKLREDQQEEKREEREEDPPTRHVNTRKETIQSTRA